MSSNSYEQLDPLGMLRRPKFDITGQLVFRDSGQTTPDGRRLMMVVGILAMPEGAVFPEHQYTVGGNDNSDNIRLVMAKQSERDVSEKTRGNGLGQLVTIPMWRY